MPTDCSEAPEIERERGRRFGAWLRQARFDARMSIREMARATGLSASSLSVYLNDGCDKQTGKIRRPDIQTIDQIADALGLDADAGRIAAQYSPRSKTLNPGEYHLDSGSVWVIRGKRYRPDAPEVIDAVVALLEATGTRFEEQVREVGFLPAPTEKN